MLSLVLVLLQGLEIATQNPPNTAPIVPRLLVRHRWRRKQSFIPVTWSYRLPAFTLCKFVSSSWSFSHTFLLTPMGLNLTSWRNFLKHPAGLLCSTPDAVKPADLSWQLLTEHSSDSIRKHLPGSLPQGGAPRVWRVQALDGRMNLRHFHEGWGCQRTRKAEPVACPVLSPFGSRLCQWHLWDFFTHPAVQLPY